MRALYTTVQEGDIVIHDELHGTVKIVRPMRREDGREDRVTLNRGGLDNRDDKDRWPFGTAALHAALGLTGRTLILIARDLATKVATYRVSSNSYSRLFTLEED